MQQINLYQAGLKPQKQLLTFIQAAQVLGVALAIMSAISIMQGWSHTRLQGKLDSVLHQKQQLEQQIKNGWTEDQIRESWQKPLDEFKKLRSKYLLYD